MPEERTTPIYISYLTFTTLLDWLRETRTIPSQFDRSYWGHKFSGSTGAQLMAGLRFLGLLNGDEPADRLEQIAFASNDDRKKLLTDLLRDVYGPEMVEGLARATPNMVNDRLRALGTTDSTHAKARSFFVNAAKAVGLQMPGQIAKQARNRPSVTRKPGTPRRKAAGEAAGPTGAAAREANPEVPPAHRTRRQEEEEWLSKLDPTVLTWLMRVPGATTPWSKADRDAWNSVLQAIFGGVWREDG